MLKKNSVLVIKKTIDFDSRSFMWTSMAKGNEINDDLSAIYKTFKKHKLIDKKTTLLTFCEVFKGRELEKIKVKINWIGSLRLLIYFFVRLAHRQHIISNSDSQWIQLEKTFLWKQKPIKRENSAEIFSKLYTYKSEPKNAMIIEDVLRQLF